MKIVKSVDHEFEFRFNAATLVIVNPKGFPVSDDCAKVMAERYGEHVVFENVDEPAVEEQEPVPAAPVTPEVPDLPLKEPELPTVAQTAAPVEEQEQAPEAEPEITSSDE